MFSKDKYNSKLSPAEQELELRARRRIKQKRRLFQHLLIFLAGSVFMVTINMVFGYGKPYNWYIWAIIFWAFLLVLHAGNVLVTNKFLGEDWEKRQRENLVQLQKKKIAAIQKEIETEFPLSNINKKKS